MSAEKVGHSVDLAVLGIAEVAGWAVVEQMTKPGGGSLDAVKIAVRESVYWGQFCDLAAAGKIPAGWQREPIATAVVGWAKADRGR